MDLQVIKASAGIAQDSANTSPDYDLMQQP